MDLFIWILFSLCFYFSPSMIMLSLTSVALMIFMKFPLFGNLLYGGELYGTSHTLEGYFMLILSIWVMLMCLGLMSLNLYLFQTMCKTLLSMLFVLILVFSTTSYFMFYFLFELSLIPIFVMIMGWGYQPERLSAGLSMLLYTVFASLPLFVTLLLLSQESSITLFTSLLKQSFSSDFFSGLTSCFTLIVVLSFLVKFPMFLIHLWLPKAHVEAPVMGSMVLAAILLKLGGYGIIRLSPLIFNSFLKDIIIMVSLLGGAYTSLLCLRQTDMKILIAYSSVAHMALSISCFLVMTLSGLIGGIMMMLAHGVISSGLFSGAFFSYTRWNSRNMMISKSLLNCLPIFSMWWFLLCAFNMGAPPSLNLLSEIISIIAVMSHSSLVWGPLAILLMGAVAYCLLLFSSTQQGQVSHTHPCAVPLSMQETLTMSNHSIPVALLPLVSCFLV